jgi:hypothetical protein
MLLAIFGGRIVDSEPGPALCFELDHLRVSGAASSMCAAVVALAVEFHILQDLC